MSRVNYVKCHYEIIHYAMTQILELSCVSFSYVSISFKKECMYVHSSLPRFVMDTYIKFWIKHRLAFKS